MQASIELESFLNSPKTPSDITATNEKNFILNAFCVFVN